MTTEKTRWGIHVAGASVAHCIYSLDGEGVPTAVVNANVRICGTGRTPKGGRPTAEDRRVARSARRRRDRMLRRNTVLHRALGRAGLYPMDADGGRRWGRIDGWELRSRGVRGCLLPFEVGRAIMHLAKRRGQPRRGLHEGDNESGKVKTGVARLEEMILRDGARTYGDLMHRRLNAASEAHRRPRVRARLRIPASGNLAKAWYDWYPSRQMVQDEFDAIWAAQQKHHPVAMTDEAREKVRGILLYQRPLKRPQVGRCTMMPNEARLPRAHPMASRRVLLETLNALRIRRVSGPHRALAMTERELLMEMLDGRRHTASITGMRVSFKKLGAAIGLTGEERFTHDRPGRRDLECDMVRAAMTHPERLGDAWLSLGWDAQWETIDRILHEPDEEALRDWLMARHGIDAERAAATMEAPLTRGYTRLGETATRILVEVMDKEILSYTQAARKCGLHHSRREGGRVYERLPYYGEVLGEHVMPGTGNPDDNDIARHGRIGNPTVHLVLNQLRVVVNQLLAIHGRPNEIHVEVGTDLKQSAASRMGAERGNAARRREGDVRTATLEGMGLPLNARNHILLRLWAELGKNESDRRCPYSGELITRGMVFDGSCVISYLLPYARSFDDGMTNMVLCRAECSRAMENRTAWEAWGGTEQWAHVEDAITRLPKKKQGRLLPEAIARLEDEGPLRQRAFSDSAYVSRMAGMYLECLYPESKARSRVARLSGRVTERLRRTWWLNRLLPDYEDTGDSPRGRRDYRHRIIDAAVVGVIDQRVIDRLVEVGERDAGLGRDIEGQGVPAPWDGLYDALERALGEAVVSHRRDRGTVGFDRSGGRDNTSGQLHNETSYKITGREKNGTPLVRHRVALEEFAGVRGAKKLSCVCNTELREALEKVVVGRAEVDARIALREFSDKPGRFRGIWRAMIEEAISVVPIRDLKGRVYRGVKPDGNAHAEVWQLPNGKWWVGCITRFAAHQGERIARPHGGARRLMRLHINDTLELTFPENPLEPRWFRIVKMSGGEINLAEHFEAKVSQRNRDKDDPYRELAATGSKLRDLDATLVRVDAAGRVHYC